MPMLFCGYTADQVRAMADDNVHMERILSVAGWEHVKGVDGWTWKPPLGPVPDTVKMERLSDECARLGLALAAAQNDCDFARKVERETGLVCNSLRGTLQQTQIAHGEAEKDRDYWKKKYYQECEGCHKLDSLRARIAELERGAIPHTYSDLHAPPQVPCYCPTCRARH